MTSPDAHYFLVAIDTSCQHPKMVSLLLQNLFETSMQALATSKDFYQVIVTRKEVGERGRVNGMTNTIG